MAPGSASSTVSSCHSFHGWNQYSPNPTATTTTRLRSARCVRPIADSPSANFPPLPIQRNERPSYGPRKVTEVLRLCRDSASPVVGVGCYDGPGPAGPIHPASACGGIV